MLYASLGRTNSTSSTRDYDILASWFYEDFSRHLIDYWYRKTAIIVSKSEHLAAGGMLHCDRLGSQLIPALSIGRLVVSVPAERRDQVAAYLKMILALDPAVRRGATIICKITDPYPIFPRDRKRVNVSRDSVMEAICPEIDLLAEKGYHFELLV